MNSNEYKIKTRAVDLWYVANIMPNNGQIKCQVTLYSKADIIMSACKQKGETISSTDHYTEILLSRLLKHAIKFKLNVKQHTTNNI